MQGTARPDPRAIRFGAAGPLRGNIAVPGDKSISHRALMVAAVAEGRSSIRGLCDGVDLSATVEALRAFGVPIHRDGATCLVDGVGAAGLRAPETALDMGNSGTSARLLMGLIASRPITARLIGDESLCRRPMDRVIAPLRRIGARIEPAPGDRLPLTIAGTASARPIRHETAVASAQVKSALLLAALNIPGETVITEAIPTRDHGELMLRHFGAPITIERSGGAHISLSGPARLQARPVDVPRDISAAAFPLVAALIVPGSDVRIERLVLNPMRAGLLTVLARMGADLRIEITGSAQGEPVGTVTARHSRLRGGDLFGDPASADLVAATIDEFPIFFIAAAFAHGRTRVSGLSELRVKESDRIAAMAAGLSAIGASVEQSRDGLVITGSNGAPLAGGATIDPALDHRVAMAFAVAGLHCIEPVTVNDMSVVRTSFPGFANILAALGADPQAMAPC
ncbi:MAG TPA: 3-phosphoshikimate 1-carboxyvinyltransferase [Allosphingosinicella sp.]|jgi:3-phosphoshikimate 1-carboxyvinyltransferase